MLALSSMRVFSTSFSFASTWTSVSLIGVTSEPSSCWRRVRSIAASRWHVADLLVGQLQEFIGAGLEGGGGERLNINCLC